MISMVMFIRRGYKLIGIALVVAFSFVAAEKALVQTTPKIKEPSPEQELLGYKVIKKSCPEEKNCLIFISVNDELFICNKMKELAVSLKKEFASYRQIRILLFDNPTIASEYLRGIRAPKDIDKDIRGVYEYNPAKSLELIEFAPEKGGKFNEIRINLGKRPETRPVSFPSKCTSQK